MKIPYLNLPKMNQEYEESFIKSVKDIFSKGCYVGGEYVSSFERKFEERNGSKFAIGTSNGTDALGVILKTLDIKTDGFIYYPENTFIGSILSGLQMGYWFKPYPVNKNTFNADEESLKHIGEDASAVITVNLYGHSINCIESFQGFCEQRGIPLIEDVSQAHFQTYKNKTFGNFGKMSFYSLYPGKNLGSIGDAGVICTNDEMLAKKAKSITNYGMVKRHDYQYRGFNHRLDSIQAAFLTAKIDNINNVINKRREIARKYIFDLCHNENISIIKPNLVEESVWHIFCIRADNRDNLKNFLQESGIETNIHYPVKIHEIDCWKNQIEKTKIEYTDTSNILSLPCYETMTKDDVEYVVNKIREFYK